MIKEFFKIKKLFTHKKSYSTSGKKQPKDLGLFKDFLNLA